MLVELKYPSLKSSKLSHLVHVCSIFVRLVELCKKNVNKLDYNVVLKRLNHSRSEFNGGNNARDKANVVKGIIYFVSVILQREVYIFKNFPVFFLGIWQP